MSTLVLRVPIGQVQAAIAELSGYGTLLAQKISSMISSSERIGRQLGSLLCRRAIAAIAGPPRGPLRCERASQARAAARGGRAAARHDAEATRGRPCAAPSSLASVSRS